MNKKIKNIFVLLLSLGLILGSLGFVVMASKEEGQPEYEVQEGKEGGTLIVREGGDPMSFNPSITPDDFLYSAAQNMFNRLTKLDASKQVIPDLAESWDVSDDALTITFQLKENAKWWDGKPVTSKDVKYTFDYMKEHDTIYFSSKLDIVDSIDAPDEYTVVFNMNKADVSFIATLGWYGTFILPEHIFNNGQTWEENPASKNPVGSGPFKFVEFVQGQKLVLEANKEYHDGAPKLDKLIYSIVPDDATAVQAILNGELDVLGPVPGDSVPDLENNDIVKLYLDRYPSPIRIIFNLKNEKVADLALREAIAYCIDRDAISEKAFGGIMPPEYSVYPSMVSWAANTEDVYPSYDLEKARKILEDAGYEKDKDGFYVRGLTLDVFEGQTVDACKLLVASCKEAGIEVELIVSEFNAWFQKVGTDRDFMIECQGGFMGPDPSALKGRIGTDQNSNYAAYSNKEVDKLLDEGAATGNQEERGKIYREIQKLLRQDLPYINMVSWTGYDCSRADLVNLPIQGAGKWGWQEYTWTAFSLD